MGSNRSVDNEDTQFEPPPPSVEIFKEKFCVSGFAAVEKMRKRPGTDPTLHKIEKNGERVLMAADGLPLLGRGM